MDPARIINRAFTYKLFLSSTLSSLKAWVALWAFMTIVQVIFGYSLGIPSRILFERVDFMINPDDWSGDAVKILFSLPAISPLIFSIICLIISFHAIPYQSPRKLFFVWGFFHGWTYAFGAIIIGLLSNTGFCYAADWLYLFDTQKFLLTIFSIFFLFLAGFIISTPVCHTAGIFFQSIKEDSYPRFIFFTYTLPAITVSLIVISLFYPYRTTQYSVPPLILFSLITLSLKSRGFQDADYQAVPNAPEIKIWSIILFYTILIILKIIMSFGIHFGSYKQ